MTLHTERYKVGTFLLASGALFVLFLAFVVGRALFRTDTYYHIRFVETVKGLVAGAAVHFHGVPIGNVSSMRLEGDTTVVRIRVDPSKAMVQEGVTRAALERNPVTGLATVELEGWRRGAPELPPDSVIPADPSWGSEVMMTLPRILQALPETLNGITEAAGAVKALLGADLPARLNAVIKNLDTLSARLPEALEELNREGAGTFKSVRQAADRLAAEVEQLGRSALELSREAREAAGEARGAVAELRGAAQAGRTLLEGPELKSALAEVTGAASAFRESLAHLRGALDGSTETLARTGRELGPVLDRLALAADALGRLAGLLGDNPSALIWAGARPERPIPDPPPAGGRRE